jgi:hypothetical protein
MFWRLRHGRRSGQNVRSALGLKLRWGLIGEALEQAAESTTYANRAKNSPTAGPPATASDGEGGKTLGWRGTVIVLLNGRGGAPGSQASKERQKRIRGVWDRKEAPH